MRTPNVDTWTVITCPVLVACAVACSSGDRQNGAIGIGGAVGTAGGAGPAAAGAGGASGSSGTGGAAVPGGGAISGAGGAIAPASAGGATSGGIGNFGGRGAAGTPPSAGGGGGFAGAGAATGGASASGGSAGTGGSVVGDAGTTPGECMGGKVGSDSTGARAGTEYGAVKYSLATTNAIVSLKTVLKVPKKPTMTGTLFIWPGLQWLGGTDPARIGNGILQPVLTWGSSCAKSMPMDYSSWWISAMYVNVSTSAAGPTGCAGGASMTVAVADLLKIDMSVTGTTWKQTVLDEQTSKSVDFSIDLKGQVQDWATWAIEIPAGGNVVPTEDIVFTDSVLTFKSPVTSCQPNQRGPNDYFSAPRASSDGLSCCIDRIVLRARGVPATTMP